MLRYVYGLLFVLCIVGVTAPQADAAERECRVGFFQIWNTPDVKAQVAGMNGHQEARWGWENRFVLESTKYQVRMTLYRTHQDDESQVLWRKLSSKPMDLMDGENAPDCALASIPGSKLCWRVWSDRFPLELSGDVREHEDGSFSICTGKHAAHFASSEPEPNWGLLMRIGVRRKDR